MKKMKPGDDVDYEPYDLDTTEFVCSKHINESFIKKHIRNIGVKGTCNYCGRKLKVVELRQLLELIIVGIEYLFEDPLNTRSYNKEGTHGFDGNTFDFYDLWYEDYLGLEIQDDSLFEDIYKYLKNHNLYCYKDEYESESGFWNSIWNRFQDVVKHEARYVFHFENVFSKYHLLDPVSILDKVQESILKFELIREINIGTKLYRCRQHKFENEITESKHMASPPQSISKDNGRMNPAGISMFYCSQNKELTIKEVVDFSDSAKPFYTTAIFKNSKKIRLVDLSQLPKKSSIFNSTNNGDIETIFFLEEFIKDIAKPVLKGESIIEYIPTQIVTEYIRFNPKLNVDGIIYPSSKDHHNNFVLFYDHKKSIKELIFSKRSIRTTKT